MFTAEKKTNLLTTREAAHVLGLSPATLNTWRSRRGRVARDGLNGPPYVRIGRTIRYPDFELNEWIASHPAFCRTGE